MKNIILIACALSLTGCATMAPISYQEECALKGMALSGVSSGTSTGHISGSIQGNQRTANGRNYGHENHDYSGTTVTYSETVNCYVPQTEKQQCQVNALGESARPKAEWNSRERSRHVWRIIGYVLYIVPGVIMSVVHESGKDDSIKESQEIAHANSGACNYQAEDPTQLSESSI